MYFNNNKLFITLCLLCLFCCNESPLIEEPQTEDPQLFLNLYMDSELINGHYVFNYPIGSPNSYTTVYYKTLSQSRVEWTSIDSFSVTYMGAVITEPIINYATYSNSEGEGRQLIYLNPSLIESTLSIVGCVGSVCEELSFICK